MNLSLAIPAPRLTGRQAEDFYRTPPEATRALLAVESPPHRIWEPACGDGAISEVLIAAGHQVYSTDLVDRGYGTPGTDFLTDAGVGMIGAAVVTNPPFKLADRFVRHALDLGAPYVAMLGRLAWLEGAARRRTLWAQHPPSRIWVFSRRMTLWRGDEDRPAGASGTTAYAWFVWQRGHAGPVLGWLP